MQLSFPESLKPFGVTTVMQTLVKMPKCESVVNNDLTDCQLVVSETETIVGQEKIIMYLLGAYKCKVLDDSDREVTLRWIPTIFGLTDAQLVTLNRHFKLRPFLMAGKLALVDLILGAVVPGDRARALELSDLQRYLTFVSTMAQVVGGVKLVSQGIAKHKRAAMGGQSAAAKKAAQKVGKKTGVSGTAASFGLKDAVDGQVVTRFPPEPSGYLHIGHVKAALLNHHVAEMYHGKMLFRLDDTNPAKESPEFVDNIKRDLQSLGVTWSSFSHTSDHFPLIQSMAEKMIKEGKAYVDDTDVETIRDERAAMKDSRCRGLTVEENLTRWEAMKAGAEAARGSVLRAKIDMQSPNGCMRDPVLYRYSPDPHHRTGTTYCVYPTYDLACPIVDSVEGVTHALRTLEFSDRNEQYRWIATTLGLRVPSIMEFARMNLVYTVLSKRKLQAFVDRGIVDGWWDPRFPTVQGIMRRGLTVQALREFVVSQGQSRNSNYMEWEKLWVLNKKIIDPTAPRLVAVDKEMTRMTLTGPGTEEATVELPRHKKCPAAGTKPVVRGPVVWIDTADAALLKAGDRVTLMDWGNCTVTGVGEGVTATFNPEDTNFKGTTKLTWLADGRATQEAELVKYGHLVTKRILEDGDDPEAFLSDHSKVSTRVMVDPRQWGGVKKGDIVQVERKGFCYVDQVEGGLVLNIIPDGRKE